jgi:ATP phosphoribosyltransferase
MDPTLQLLRNAGLAFERTERSLTVPVRNVPIDLLFVRTEDIVEMVADGVAEAGIAGLDLLGESGLGLEVVAGLGYGRCQLTAAVPKDSPIERLDELAGLRVATAHPRLVRKILQERQVSVGIVPLRGSVELAPKLGVAEGIVDLVSSGSTLLVNDLRPLASLLDSEAILVRRPGVNGGVDEMATMLRAVVAGRRRRYVMMNAPADSVARLEGIIPGLEAPSVIPLAHDGKVAIHSVIDADELWHVLPELEAAGASGILVLPIEQLIP